MKIQWNRLGSQLGLLYCLAGLFLVFLGWNGAATYDDVPAQMPYLISGGIAGLSLVVIGVGVIIAQSHRADRAALQATLNELRDALERVSAGSPPVAAASPAGLLTDAGPDTVLAGPSTYHRPDCRLVEGHTDVVPMSLAAASSSGLAPCRVCAPAAARV